MSCAPVTLAGRVDGGRLVLCCEHASASVPAEYGNLGLALSQLVEHIGWDIGAADLTSELGRLLGAPAVLSGASRLLVDCNRDLTDSDLMPMVSHGTSIPGNAAVTGEDRAARIARYYDPYHAAVDAQLTAYPDSLLLSIHSFTPSLNGTDRDFDVGVLFDAFEDLAANLGEGIAAAGFRVRLNEPYSGFDGLIYSARRHGRRHRIRYLELEINNRLLRSEFDAQAVANQIGAAVARLVGLSHVLG